MTDLKSLKFTAWYLKVAYFLSVLFFMLFYVSQTFYALYVVSSHSSLACMLPHCVYAMLVMAAKCPSQDCQIAEYDILKC